MVRNGDNMVLHEKTKSAFRGRSVLLTGASGGLGKALALQLASCGVRSLILSARDAAALERVAEECQERYNAATTTTGGSGTTTTTTALAIRVLTCDLSDPKSVDQLARDALNECSSIDVLINNGGVSSRSRFVDTVSDVDEKIMQINFLSGAALAKAVVPGMISKGQGGRIIWISSVQGLMGIPNRSSYAASKFAVQGYTESIRAELAPSGISVHTISPGYIRTNLSKSALTGDGAKYDKIDATTAAGADPDEVAATILNQVAMYDRPELVVAATFSAKVALWLKFCCPWLLRTLLVKRYQKSLEQEKKDA